MGLLSKLFNKKSQEPHAAFWAWFKENGKSFFEVVNSKEGKIEELFFRKLSPKLNEIKEGIFYLTGMYNKDTAELILTAEGQVKNFVFVERVVEAAPEINGWKFTALVPAMKVEDVNIEMAGYKFNRNYLSFYANEIPGMPDEIDLIIVYTDLNKDDLSTITNGIYIFLDNYLGELNFATTIDMISVVGIDEVQKETISIGKLKDYLTWRQAEFIEKYEDTRYDTENDIHSSFEAEHESGKKSFGVFNTDLLKWENKASHPWIMNIEIAYNGSGKNGMPDEATYQLLDKIEDDISSQLQDHEGYLYVGRKHYDGIRDVYFACKDFRKPSLVTDVAVRKYAPDVEMKYNIYKDKYWDTFSQFSPQ